MESMERTAMMEQPVLQGIQGVTGANGTNGTNGIDGAYRSMITRYYKVSVATELPVHKASKAQPVHSRNRREPMELMGLTELMGPQGD